MLPPLSFFSRFVAIELTDAEDDAVRVPEAR